jgi:hypothetical protein
MEIKKNTAIPIARPLRLIKVSILFFNRFLNAIFSICFMTRVVIYNYSYRKASTGFFMAALYKFSGFLWNLSKLNSYFTQRVITSVQVIPRLNPTILISV